MKSLLVILSLVMGLATTSYGAINCTGVDEANTQKTINVSIDGNPLKIMYRFPSYGWGSLLVSVLEKSLILAEGSYGSGYIQTRGQFEKGLRNLPKGYNAKLTLREVSRITVESKKHVYLLKCSGRLPSVYRSM